MKIKGLIKSSSVFKKIISICYNIVYSPLLFFKKNIQFHGAFIRGIKIIDKGVNNKIIIGEISRLKNCTIRIIGNNNTILLGGGNSLHNTSLWIEGNSNMIVIGKQTSIGGGQLAALEGTSITIGEDCMFSRSIAFRTSDSHVIKDQDGNRINPAKSIIIGDHVWLGAHVTVLKGVEIAPNSIVGIGAIVTSSLSTSNTIYAGIPAKKVKENIHWSRN